MSEPLVASLGQLLPKKVLVVGDYLLDMYTKGSVGRISPEAPVSVLKVEEESFLPGGAGNVVSGLQALGNEVFALGRIGADAYGQMLQEALNTHEGLIVESDSYMTPLKNRVIAGSQQLMRIDREEIRPISKETEDRAITILTERLEDFDICLVSDYGKGFVTPRLMQALNNLAAQKQIPVFVDPKGIDFSKYNGATLIKPNLKEAYEAAGLGSEASLEEVAQRIFEKVPCLEWLMITRAKEGISLFNKALEHQHFPVRVRQVMDVTGAGDTVLVTLAHAWSNALSPASCIELANVAAGLAIEQVGCVSVALSDIAKLLFSKDRRNKVLCHNQLFCLQTLSKDARVVMLHLEPIDTICPELFFAIKELSQTAHKSHTLLGIYMEATQSNEAVIAMLSSLEEVDFLIIENEGLSQLLGKIQPDEVYQWENGLKKLENSKQLLNLVC